MTSHISRVIDQTCSMLPDETARDMIDKSYSLRALSHGCPISNPCTTEGVHPFLHPLHAVASRCRCSDSSTCLCIVRERLSFTAPPWPLHFPSPRHPYSSPPPSCESHACTSAWGTPHASSSRTSARVRTACWRHLAMHYQSIGS